MTHIANLPRDAAALPQAQPCAHGITNHPRKTALWNYTPDAVLAHLQTATARPQQKRTTEGAAA